MENIFEIIIFTGILSVIGGLLILSSLANKRQSEKLYWMYRKFTNNFGSTIIEDCLSGNRFPMIYGKYGDRKIFIRSIFQKERGFLTAFGVEHKIPIDKKVIITIPIKNQRYRGYPINITNLKNTPRNYEIYSNNKSNERILNEIFTEEVSNYFKLIDNKNPESFYYVVLESGIIILHIYSWEHNKDILKNYLTDLTELVRKMEKSTNKLSDKIENYRFKEINIGYNIQKEFINMIFIFFLIIGVIVLFVLGAIIVFERSFNFGGFILLNLGIYFILAGFARIYTNRALKKLMGAYKK